MKFAYADPPYIGQAKKHYNSEEVNHLQLVHELEIKFPDGWALSCSSPTLRDILNMCTKPVRVMVWVKPFCSFKPNVNPAYAWEPVIVYGGRKRGRDLPTVRDFVSCNITLKKGLSGVKPEDFCFWLFEILGMKKDDELEDLFPGSGAVTRAFEKWKSS